MRRTISRRLFLLMAGVMSATALTSRLWKRAEPVVAQMLGLEVPMSVPFQVADAVAPTPQPTWTPSPTPTDTPTPTPTQTPSLNKVYLPSIHR